MPPQPLLNFENVSKNISNEFSISPISLKIEPGRSHVLLGPSGCGKTTLMKMVMGLISPDSGIIQISGRQITEIDEASLLDIMGYAQQHSALFPHLTVFENIAMPHKVKGVQLKENDPYFKSLLDLLEIDIALIHRPHSQLSGGQRQRISIIRSLILKPQLLLLDEPLSALDPILKNKLYTDLKDFFSKHNISVLLVTHDLLEAQIFSDEVSLLKNGSVVQQGPFENLVKSPSGKFVEDFFNSQRIRE